MSDPTFSREQAALDGVFGALADPTRRGIISRLTQGPCSVTELGAPFAMSAPAISKHLSILERAGLIARWKSGRVHYCRLLVDPLGRVGQWIEQHRAFWERQLDALEDFLGQGSRKMQSAAAQATGLGIELQRRFRATPERVFHAWTQPSARPVP